MKSDRHTYIADRPPTLKSDFGFDRRTSPLRAREPVDSDPPRNHTARLIEYDDWLRQEERRYSKLLTELKKARWLSESDPPLGRPPTVFSESDVGEFLCHHAERSRSNGGPPGRECDVGRRIDELLSSELETIRLTDDEVYNDCGFTMEQALLKHRKPPVLEKDKCSSINSTQHIISFQYTLSVRGPNIFRSPMIEAIQAARSKLSESAERESKVVNRLWLEVGKLHSKFLECDSTAAISSAGPGISQRFDNLHSGFHRHRLVLPVPWDSVMVESVRLVLQRWRGVCSFSQTMRSYRSDEESHFVYDLRSKKRSRPGE